MARDPMFDDAYLAFLAAAQAADLTHIETANVFYQLDALAPRGPLEPPLPVFCLCAANINEVSDASLAQLEMYCIRVRTPLCV